MTEGKPAPTFHRLLADRLPFYYGWVMIPIAVIARVVTGVGQTYGISVFNPSLLESLGISLSTLSGAYTAGTLAAALPQPYLGALMDRFGARKAFLGVVLLLGAACLFFASVNSTLTLLIGFFLLRLLGQGGLSMLAGNLPALWFRSKLGTVAGIVSSGFSLGVAIIPSFFLYLISRLGWRTTYSWLGILVWAIMLPLIGLMQDHPGKVGQILDHKQEPAGIEQDSSPPAERAFSARAARRTPAYWILLVNSSLWSLVITAVFFNLLPIMASRGIPDITAAATYTTYAVTSLLAQLLLGSLANRGSLRVLLLAGMLSLAGGVGVLALVSSAWMAHAYAVLFGVSAGLISLLGGTFIARYFGRANLGQLQGGLQTAQVAGSSLGPFLTGLIYDLSGSFQISLWIFVALLIPAGMMSLRAVPPAWQSLEESV